MDRRKIYNQFSALSFRPSVASIQPADPGFVAMEIGKTEWVGPHGGPRKARQPPRGTPAINTDFRCANCGAPVTAAAWLSGVQNRNHCPHCLWSRHLDLHTAGDRLSACKEKMRPIGLALKQTRKKYTEGVFREDRTGAGVLAGIGELMLAHQCQGCGKLSVNRIAADDDAEALMHIFHASLALDAVAVDALAAGGVHLLRQKDAGLVRRRLFGE